MPVKRIFVAVDIPEDVRSRVEAYAADLKGRFQGVPAKWVKPENFHLTLRFVGNTSEKELIRLTRDVECAVRATRPFVLEVSGTGAFVKRESAVLWVGIIPDDNGDGLQKIYSELNIAVDRQPARELKPHLTIARIKTPHKARDLIRFHREADLTAGEFTVRDLTIYESTLLPSGSVYSVVSKHRLA